MFKKLFKKKEKGGDDAGGGGAAPAAATGTGSSSSSSSKGKGGNDADDDIWAGKTDERVVDQQIDIATASDSEKFAEFCRRGIAEEVIALLKKNKNLLTEKSAGGAQGIHWAARGGDVETIEALVNAGASLAAIDDNGDTPLHVASAKGNGDACIWMTSKGGSALAKNKKGQTPLDLCKNDAAREGLSGRRPSKANESCINIIKDDDDDDDDDDDW